MAEQHTNEEMATERGDGEVVHNEAEHRFELPIEGGLALIAYRREGDVLVMHHTEVPEESEGEGYGSRLVRGALRIVEESGLRIRPACPFVRAYIERHPEHGSLVAQS